MDMSEMRACRILNIWKKDTLTPANELLIWIEKMKANFKKGGKNRSKSPYLV